MPKPQARNAETAMLNRNPMKTPVFPSGCTKGLKAQRLRWGAVGSLAVALSVLMGVSCGEPFESCESLNSCPEEGGVGGTGGASEGGIGGGTGTGGGAGADAGGCDPLENPDQSECAIEETYGVFVSPNGNDETGDGSRENPFATIAHGLSATTTERKRVYICADGGEYTESIAIDAELDGRELYGGLSCDDWSYGSELRAVVKSPVAIALKVESLSVGLIVSDFSFESKDASEPGGSSFGAFVSESDNVLLRRVTLSPGKGAEGDDGEGLTAPAASGAPGTDGTAACTVETAPNAGGTEVETECGGEASGSKGGKGGDGGSGDNSAGTGNRGQPVPEPDTGQGAAGTGEANVGWDCSVGLGKGGANVGANGASGTSGKGAPGPGTLTPAGFTPASGENGEDGQPGQGGGGGGGAKAPASCDGKPRTGASGGSGGGGGCGGIGGKGGQGGGASIALASVSSSVTLEDCELIAKTGGDGGDGGAAQPGGSGGPAGSGASGGLANDSCAGGQGGKGGNGGHGGGGAGGPSLGIAYVGMAPSVNGGSIKLAESASLGGADGAGATTGEGAGAAGLIAEIQEF